MRNKRNSVANGLDLRLFCIKPAICARASNKSLDRADSMTAMIESLTPENVYIPQLNINLWQLEVYFRWRIYASLGIDESCISVMFKIAVISYMK